MIGLNAAQAFLRSPLRSALPEKAIAACIRRTGGGRLSCLLGCGMFYLVRSNLDVVTVEMQDALHYTKEMIGDIVAMTAIAYGLSKFLMGAVSDRSNAHLWPLVADISCVQFRTFGASRVTTSIYFFGLSMVLPKEWDGPPAVALWATGSANGNVASRSASGTHRIMWAAVSRSASRLGNSNYGGWEYAFYVLGRLPVAGRSMFSGEHAIRRSQSVYR